MKAKFKYAKRINSKVLLEKLRSITNKEGNQIKFDAFAYEELQWIFISVIDFGSIYSAETRRSILGKAFRKIGLNEKYDEQNFFEILNKEIIEHNKKEEKQYYFLASLSIKKIPIRKTKIGSCVITVTGKNYPKKFVKHRKKIHEDHDLNAENSDYLKVVVSIKAKSFLDAYEEANKSFEVFRGMLCLVTSSNLELRFGSGATKPINKVRMGKYSSLHLENGENANINYLWFDSSYVEAKVFTLNEEEQETLKKSLKWFIKLFNQCKINHQVGIAKALNIYVGAYDESNKHICFLKAWTALETILNTDNNDLLIKRCLSMYHEDHKLYKKQILESLRGFRNELVHEGDNALDPSVSCYMVQNTIYDMIVRFNLRYAGFFENIDESVLFLDNYSPDLKELEKRKKILDRAIKLKEKNTRR